MFRAARRSALQAAAQPILNARGAQELECRRFGRVANACERELAAVRQPLVTPSALSVRAQAMHALAERVSVRQAISAL